MVDTVNVGSAPDAGDGDPLHTAFSAVNVAIAALQAVSPVTVSGLNDLTLSASTVAERVAKGTAIGTITNQTGGTTLRMADPMDTQFQFDGDELQAGPQLLDSGTVNAVIEEIIDTGTSVLSKITTLPITVTRDAGTWPVIVPTIWAGNADNGLGDGSSYANRKDVRNVGPILTPGAIVGVAEDIDPLTAGLPQTISGTALNPIKYIGCDSAGKRTQRFFHGVRHAYRKNTHDVEETLAVLSDTDDHVTGVNVFQLQGGLGYYDFEDLGFIDMQVCFNVQAPLTHNINIRRIYGKNVQRMFETTNANYANDVLIDGFCVVMFSKGIFRWRGASNGFTLQNGYADAMRLDGDSWPSLGAMDHTSQNVAISDVEIYNCHNDQGAGYWNADGWSIENDNNGLSITNYTSMGHTDAGLDCKTGSSILNVTGGLIGDNKRNLKCWPGISGNAKFHFENITLTAPNKRGGSGSACHINCNGNASGNVPYPIEVRVKDMDLRLADKGWAGQELANDGTYTTVIYKFINVQRDASPIMSNVDLTGQYVRFMIASAMPTGSTTLLSSASSITGGLGGTPSIPITTNRDASHGGVLIRSIGGTDGALFKVDGTSYSTVATAGILQSISPTVNIPYTGTGADVKSINVVVEDLAGTQNTLAYTVTITADAADHRVLDLNFAGANNSQTAVDVSPVPATLVWGTSAKTSTVHDAAGSLRVPFTTNGSTIGRVVAQAGYDGRFDINGQFTIVVDDLYLDTAATGLNQTVAARWASDKTWRLYVDATGHLTFEVWSSGAVGLTLANPAAFSNATDYDIKIRRTLTSFKTYLWEMLVGGVVVSSLSSAVIPAQPEGAITIGSNGLSNDYMQGYIKRVAIYQNITTGT